MNNFNYYNPTELIFGENVVTNLNELLRGKYARVLLHYGGGTIKILGLYDEVKEILKKSNVDLFELGGVEPNPKLNLVREGIELCNKENIDFILAVGGGSVIDSAKAIAVGAKSDEDIWDYFLGKEDIKRALPIGVILTIPATGSETSSGSVVTNTDGQLKRSIGSDLIRPKFALMDPYYTMSLPKYQTFAGITDIYSHIHERYFTSTENVELTTNLCEATFRTVIDNAYKLKEDLNDYGARSEIMLAGSIAHGGILGMGREEDWASHRMGHEITGLYGTTHGVTLSIILPAWMEYQYENNIDLFKRYAVEIFDVSIEGKTDKEIAYEGIKELKKFLKDIDMPVSFTEAGIPTDKFELMAKKCVLDGPVGSLKSLEYEDVLNVYKIAK